MFRTKLSFRWWEFSHFLTELEDCSKSSVSRDLAADLPEPLASEGLKRGWKSLFLERLIITKIVIM